MKPAAFALLGPTAGGKSRFAMELAAKIPLEIVSVDSAQVYRGMDIGTAKPSAAERRAVPHHLLDIADPTERYSAGCFRTDAMRAIEGIHARGKTPLLVGGTMLYYRVLVSGLNSLPQADAGIRAEIDERAGRLGWPALHAELAKIDPAAAQRIQPGDGQRIQRALEVWRLAGKPLSALQSGKKESLPFELKAFVLVPDSRSELHQRIAERFDEMLKQGLVDELRNLRKHHKLTPDLPSMRCVGYRQTWNFLERKSSESEMREAAIAATRQLAKRQLTWLRSLPGLQPAARLADAISRA